MIFPTSFFTEIRILPKKYVFGWYLTDIPLTEKWAHPYPPSRMVCGRKLIIKKLNSIAVSVSVVILVEFDKYPRRAGLLKKLTGTRHVIINSDNS